MLPAKALLALCAIGLSTACATPTSTPINRPMQAGASAGPVAPVVGANGEAIALALSGGGARAAAFSYGVLLELRDRRDANGQRLIDDVSLVTAVSGSAPTAAWLGLHGVDGLDGYRAEVLDKDWAGPVRDNVFWPPNWLAAMDGGMNGPAEIADWLDREAFKGARMDQMRARPRVLLNATELYTGTPFVFAPPWFDAICSELGSVRVADAVAASMAAPLVIRPVLAESFADGCSLPLPAWVKAANDNRAGPALLRQTAQAFTLYRDPTRMKYLHLVDGGVADNFGLASLVSMRQSADAPYGPFSAEDGVRLKRLTILVVNAELPPAGDWPLHARGPNGVEVLTAALAQSVNSGKRGAFATFAAVFDGWKRELVDWRCALPAEEARRLGAGPGWACRDFDIQIDTLAFTDLPEGDAKILGGIPTTVSLPRDKIDALIAGGRQVVAINPTLANRLAK